MFSRKSWNTDFNPNVQQGTVPKQTLVKGQTEDLKKETELRKLFQEFDMGISYEAVQKYHALHPDFLVEEDI